MKKTTKLWLLTCLFMSFNSYVPLYPGTVNNIQLNFRLDSLKSCNQPDTAWLGNQNGASNEEVYKYYLKQADEHGNNNGSTDNYGEALAAVIRFLQSHDKYALRGFLVYLNDIGLPMDYRSILLSIWRERPSTDTLELYSPARPNTIEELVNLRERFSEEIKEVDSLIGLFRTSFGKSFEYGVALYEPLIESTWQKIHVLWHLKTERLAESDEVTDCTPIRDDENAGHRLMFASVNDSLLSESYRFILQCNNIVESSDGLDDKVRRLYVMDSVLDDYGKDFLKKIVMLENGRLPESGDPVAGDSSDRSATDDVNDSSCLSIDENSIGNIAALNEKLIELNNRYSSSIVKEDSLDVLIAQCNYRIAELNCDYAHIDSMLNIYNNTVSAYSDSAIKFINMKRDRFDPEFCYEKWELFKRGFSCKKEGWILILQSLDYYEKLNLARQKREQLVKEINKIKNASDGYYRQYDKLMELYEAMEKESN